MSFFAPTRILSVVSLTIVASLIILQPAAAQTRAEINKKIENLEKQLQAVQRRVFQSGDWPGGNTGADTAPVGTQPLNPPTGLIANNPALLADMEIRLAEIERQMRLLTGKIEEATYQGGQLQRDFERFKGDAEFRLTTLERDGAAGSFSATANSSPARPAADTPPLETIEEPAVNTETRQVATAVAPPPSSDPALPQGSVQDQYNYAFDYLRRGDYANAERSFTAFLDNHGGEPLAGNAQYWLGETYYARGDFPRAAQSFLSGYQDYPDSPKGPDSLLKLGMTLANLEQKNEACAAFDELNIRYPSAPDSVKRRTTIEAARNSCN